MERLMALDGAGAAGRLPMPGVCMPWRMLLLSLLRGCVMYIASVLLLCRPISSAQANGTHYMSACGMLCCR